MNRVAIRAGLVLTLALGACESPPSPTAPPAPDGVRHAMGSAQMRVNVLLRAPATAETRAGLAAHGTITGEIGRIHAVLVRTDADGLEAIRSLPYVAAAGPDAERQGAPVDRVEASDFADGYNTWNLDAVDVTEYGSRTRTVAQDGSGVYVAVLDTGLLDSWRQYFPEERIAEEHARAFVGADPGTVAETPNVWEHDTNSHGTHVTSTILGYSFRSIPINGVAPGATVIPVKVLGQAGFGWSSMIARGIVYVADLKAGPLAGHPVVINMSLGGPQLDAVEQAAIDYAIARGVIIVASAGNAGGAGMGYPGAYAPVISVAASGWVGEWVGGRSWWVTRNVPDPTRAEDFYITDFSSRARPGQDLDVAAPGSWVVGPYQLQSGKTSYFFLGGTSMASPHVAGVVALMAQKAPGLDAAGAEAILEGTAIPLAPGCRTVAQPNTAPQRFCWDERATGAGLLATGAALMAAD